MNTTVIFIGTRSEAKQFTKELRTDPLFKELAIEEPRLYKDSDSILDTEPLGQVELVEVAMHFAIAVVAHLSVEVLKAKFEEFKKAHPRVRLQEKRGAESK
jgi:hypothetical protein